MHSREPYRTTGYRSAGLRATGMGAVSLGVVAWLSGCAAPEGPNPDIEQARSEVERVAAMPIVTQHAPLELKQALDSVEHADREWRDDGDRGEAQHDAYIAAQRAAIAEHLARSRDADQRIQLANATADRARLEARSREAAAARREASQQAQVAAAQAQRAAAADQRARAANEQVRQLEARMREIEAQQTERGLLVTLGDVLFETGKSELLPTAAPRLDKLAEFLRQYPDRRLLVEGYTDAVGSEDYNLQLSQRRAEAVRMALVQRGIDPLRITTRGYGESYSVADNSSAEGRALNRRVEVVITDGNGNLRARG